jgi:Fe-S oxidoreductase
LDVAAGNAADNIAALLAMPVDYVVSACPTCTVALKHEFAKDLERAGRGDLLPQARTLAGMTRDFSSLVTALVAEGRLKLPEGQDLPSLTYHDSCHLKRGLGVWQEPRRLLGQAGYELKEMAESDMCCGMGGSYSLKFPEISAPILERKLMNVTAVKAATVALDCPGCLMQIAGGLDRRGGGPAVLHTAQLLAKLLP